MQGSNSRGILLYACKLFRYLCTGNVCDITLLHFFNDNNLMLQRNNLLYQKVSTNPPNFPSQCHESRHGQSIKIDIGKPIDKSIKTPYKSNLIIIDCIDQSIKINTHTVVSLNCYRFYQFYRRQG